MADNSDLRPGIVFMLLVGFGLLLMSAFVPESEPDQRALGMGAAFYFTLCAVVLAILHKPSGGE